MLCELVVESGKHSPQETAVADIKRGTPLDGGEAFVNANKNYDGINAVIDPREKDCDTVLSGAKYNRVPTRMYEEYATTELTIGTLVAGDYLTVTNGKFVAAAAGATSIWQYVGVYSNPYDLTMYIVKRVPAYTRP